jgi:hypothetical protein
LEDNDVKYEYQNKSTYNEQLIDQKNFYILQSKSIKIDKDMDSIVESPKIENLCTTKSLNSISSELNNIVYNSINKKEKDSHKSFGIESLDVSKDVNF